MQNSKVTLGKLLAVMASLGGERTVVVDWPRPKGKLAVREPALEDVWGSGRYGRPHSRRNKLGSHKQTMRKLGKL